MSKTKIWAVALSLSVLSLLPAGAEAAQCAFSRDLKNGSSGSDVKCLQQYLNGAGYVISAKGAGALGHETTTYYGLTKQAVAKWQKANGLPASGFFGPASRQKYISLTAAASPAPSDENNNASDAAAPALSQAEIQSKIKTILAQLNQLKDKREQVMTDNSKTKTEAKESLADAKNAIANAQTEVDHAYSRGKSVDTPNELLKDARQKLKEADRAYDAGNYKESVSLTDEVYDLVDRALTKIGITSTSKAEAREKIERVENSLKDAETKISQAESAGKPVDNSQDIMDDANEKFTAAEKAFDEKNYSKAIDLANEAEGLADDAVDAIGESNTAEAEKAISSAKTALANAKSAMNNSNSSNSISYLSSARSYVNEAKGSLNSSTYGSALNYLTRARDRIAEADNFVDDASYSNAINSSTAALQELDRSLDKL